MLVRHSIGAVVFVWRGVLSNCGGPMAKTTQKELTSLRRAALQAASLEIRRAKFNRSPIHYEHLAARLQRDYPGCRATEDRMRSAITELASLEAVPVVGSAVAAFDGN